MWLGLAWWVWLLIWIFVLAPGAALLIGKMIRKGSGSG